jgi:hypothetical protein
MKPANVLSAAVDGRVRKKRGDGPIRFRSNFRNTVYDVLRERPGWAETDSEIEWDFQWAERDWVYDSFDTMHLDPWQRMNHYRNGREVRCWCNNSTLQQLHAIHSAISCHYPTHK